MVTALPSGRPEVAGAFQDALREAGSTSLEEFVIQFNVDILAPGVDHADDKVPTHVTVM